MTIKKSNMKFLKRFSRYLLFRKLKPQQELNEYKLHIYMKKASNLAIKKKVPNKSDTILSCIYS